MREDKQQLLQQRGLAIWLTGLSGAGKTTVAHALERELHMQGMLVQVLDGDNLRAGINNNLGFSEADRSENIRRVAEVTKLFVETGVITVCCFISPTDAIRKIAKSIVGDSDYFEVFVNTPIEVCEERDVKGLYKKARRGEIGNFTGIHSPYEIPENPGLELTPSDGTPDDMARKIIKAILSKISI